MHAFYHTPIENLLCTLSLHNLPHLENMIWETKNKWQKVQVKDLIMIDSKNWLGWHRVVDYSPFLTEKPDLCEVRKIQEKSCSWYLQT